MIAPSFEPIAAVLGQGAAHYTPIRAGRSCGFGPLEVHPNKVPVERDGSISLALNGEYLVVWGDSKYERLACCGVDETLTARECAERLCALNNEDKPTRVIDLCGAESVSRHTRTSVQAELDAKAAADSQRV